MRDSGLDVKGLIAIFTYGFKVADDNFNQANCPYVTLTNYEFLIEEALKKEYITENDLGSLREWKEHPESWQK